MELNIPAIEGIGGSYLYLVDRYGAQEIYDVDFVAIPGAAAREQASSAGLTYIDHLTHNVQPRQHEDLGRFLSSGCSISARSATSTSRARPPACSPRP